jgi:ABC-type branched-subunit amino acid transport system substrate-binding protein
MLDDGSTFWRSLVTEPFRGAARRLGLEIAGAAGFDPERKSQRALAERVARSGAEAVVIGGEPFGGADEVVRAIRARLGDRVELLGGFGFGFGVPEVLGQVGPGVRGMYTAGNDLPRGPFLTTAKGKQFVRDLGATGTQFLGVPEAGQAVELVMAAIARSDGTRASVLEELRASEVRNGILGSFRFDRNGDMTTVLVPVLRITGATPPEAGLPPEFQGAVVDRVLKLEPGRVR